MRTLKRIMLAAAFPAAITAAPASEEETIRLMSTYAIKLEGDKLEGAQTITNEGDGVAVSTRPFTATRKKA